MVKDWIRLIQARKWMKKTGAFLPAWHAYLGYSLDLFDLFHKPACPGCIARLYNLDETLLRRWIEVGLTLGHLEPKGNGKVKSKKAYRRYLSKNSPYSIGILLEEMLELHIPALLDYPSLINQNSKAPYLEKEYGGTVAQTSELLESYAFPKIAERIKKRKAGSLLDMGCGYGGYLKRIYNQYPRMRLIGIEINPNVYQEAYTRLKHTAVEVRHEDMMAVEENDRRMEMIMMNNVLYYFPRESRPSLFEKAADMMTAKGTLLVISPLSNAKHGKAFSAAFNSFLSVHHNLFPLPSIKELKEDSKTSGFKIKRMDPVVKEGGWYLIELQKQ